MLPGSRRRLDPEFVRQRRGHSRISHLCNELPRGHFARFAAARDVYRLKQWAPPGYQLQFFCLFVCSLLVLERFFVDTVLWAAAVFYHIWAILCP